MTTITFDTLAAVRKLRAAGFEEHKAEEIVSVLADSQENLVSKEHFDSKVTLLQEQMNGKFLLLQWMIGFNLAFTMAMLWKVFS